MMKKQEILNKILQEIEHLKKFHIINLGVFGSYIRNEQKEDSDIDILVEFEQGHLTFDNYIGLKIYLEDLFGIEIDLVIKNDLKEGFKSNILQEVVYVQGL